MQYRWRYYTGTPTAALLRNAHMEVKLHVKWLIDGDHDLLCRHDANPSRQTTSTSFDSDISSSEPQPVFLAIQDIASICICLSQHMLLNIYNLPFLPRFCVLSVFFSCLSFFIRVVLSPLSFMTIVVIMGTWDWEN